MKLTRGARLSAAGAAAVLGILASSASAGVTPSPAGPNWAVARQTGSGGETGATTPAVASGATAPGGATAGQARPPAGPAAALPRPTAEPGAPGPRATDGQAPARFDLDGDGRDELVVGASVELVGRAVHVRYSRHATWDTLTPPTTWPGWRFVDLFTAGDFDGDGIGDLAVAAIRTTSPGLFEHGIFVYAGSVTGLDRAGARLLTGLHAGALAAGDIDGDGRDDLAVADGGANAEGHPPFRGSVTVLPGGPDGPDRAGEIVVRQVLPTWPGLVEEYFGGALALGDFTGDGHDDLVVAGFRRGAQESDVHGMVTLFPGSPAGPDPGRATKVEGQFELAGSLPVDVMAMADLNGDDRSDLVLGLPRHAGGEIVYLPGAAAGLSATGHRRINQDTPGVPGVPDDDATGGGFGFALATGDATGDGRPDLLVGANTMSVGGVSDAGSVTLIPGTAQGPTGTGSYHYHQRGAVARSTAIRKPHPSGVDPAEENDYLGSSAALLDLDGTGPLEIFVGSAYEDLHDEPVGTRFGLLTELRLAGDVPRRGEPARPTAYRLTPVALHRPPHFPVPGSRTSRIGPGLLSG
nr:FG-GAP-like repeat-containing protein [Micromonospora sp. DSM 115978]